MQGLIYMQGYTEYRALQCIAAPFLLRLQVIVRAAYWCRWWSNGSRKWSIMLPALPQAARLRLLAETGSR